jgi:hypothetical protein
MKVVPGDRVQLVQLHRPTLAALLGRVGDQQHVTRVLLDLGPLLVEVAAALQGDRVDVELPAHVGQLLRRARDHVGPDQRVRLVPDLGEVRARHVGHLLPLPEHVHLDHDAPLTDACLRSRQAIGVYVPCCGVRSARSRRRRRATHERDAGSGFSR